MNRPDPMPPELRSAYEAAEATMCAFDEGAALPPLASRSHTPSAREVRLACALLVTRELVEAALAQAAMADDLSVRWYARRPHEERVLDAARVVRAGGPGGGL